MRRTGTTQQSRGFSRGGKCGGRAVKQRVLTWGDPQRALTNRWLHEQGVPNMRTLWIVLHYGAKARV